MLRPLGPWRLLSVILAAIAVVAAGCGTQPPRQEPHRTARTQPPHGASLVTGAAGHLRELARIARRNGGNRAAGTPGDRATAAYAESRLRAAGYEVSRQPVRFPYFRSDGKPRILRATGPLPGGRRAVRALQYTRGDSVSGPIRRVGKACEERQVARLRPGDVALARRGTCPFRTKGRLAARAGAVAILVANHPGERLVSATLGRPGLPIPAVLLTNDAATVLRAGESVHVKVRATSAFRTSENLVARAPGATGRSAIIGAHLDSVPESPGLNDNGSGVAAVLDVAERLAADGTPPAKVSFALWTAEELGLIGSRRYVRRLDHAGRESVLAYLNLDMVGSPRARPTVYASGSDPTSQRLERLLQEGLRREGVRARSRAVPRSSDHAPFARIGIPVGGLFTGAGRPADACYHRACDDLANVDSETTQAMAHAARWALERLTSTRPSS